MGRNYRPLAEEDVKDVSEATEIPSKSLMSMFGPSGNPSATNLFDVVIFPSEEEGVRFQVRTTTSARF